MFAGSTVGLAGGCVFTLLLAYACTSDLRTRRIPNWLVLALAVAGITYCAIVSSLAGVLFALGGLLVGFILWFPFYLLRLLGAGDVKLFAAAGAWLGVSGTLKAALVAALVGGALALVVVARQRMLGRQVANLAVWMAAMQHGGWVAPVPVSQSKFQLPYGVALALGAAAVGWFPRLFSQ